MLVSSELVTATTMSAFSVSACASTAGSEPEPHTVMTSSDSWARARAASSGSTMTTLKRSSEQSRLARSLPAFPAPMMTIFMLKGGAGRSRTESGAVSYSSVSWCL